MEQARVDTRHRSVGLALLLLLLGAIAASILGRALPEALPADAPGEVFSAGRAMRVIERIARAPHPVGSEEHECVRANLIEELRALGLEPELDELWLFGIPLTNLLVRIPGLEPTGSVLCLAHYDSVETGPGAGDDGLGVASWLEGLRALRAGGWQPRNDVLLLLSDGEELGLLGAHVFARKHPARHEIKVVVNLEAIGNGGPAVLFELGPRNGERVRTFARTVAAPTGTSLGDAVYRRMPNDTDLSVFLVRGVRGFNLAVTTGNAAYHAPHDTPRNLDPRSLQHMGECALALLEELGGRDLGSLDAPDVTFFDLLGRRLVVYARGWDYVLVLLGLLVSGIVAFRSRPRRTQLIEEVVVHPLECALVGCLLFAAWFLIDRGVALFVPAPRWVPGNTTSGALVFVAMVSGVVALVARRARKALDQRVERQVAALLWLAVAACLTLFALPGATFALAIPLLLAAAGQWLDARTPHHGRGPELVLGAGHALLFGGTLLLGLPIVFQLLQLFQRTPDHALACLSGLVAFLAVPFLPHLLRITRSGRRVEGGLFALALLAMLGASVIARVLGWRQGALWP